MSRSRAAPIGALALAVVLGGGLAACGKMGELQRPGPLFGGPAPQHGPVQRTQAQDPNRPVQTVDPRDENATPAPPRTIPIPGQGPAPNAPGLPGAFGDPYSNPPR
jgi:hypothetical protein